MFSRLQIIEPPRPNGDSDESQGGVSDGGGHSTNLPIAPLADTQIQPRVGNGFSFSDGRNALPDGGGRHGARSRWAGHTVL